MTDSDSWLVTGAAGRLGYRLCAHLAARGATVAGTRHGRPVGLPGVTELAADLTDAADVRRAVDRAGSRYIVHTAGLTDVDRCETDPDEAERIHVDATRHVAAAARKTGAKLICISTDHLWDGTAAMVGEETPPRPINVYARTKLEGEAAALAECPETLVLRTNFFGRGRPWRPSFSDWIDETLRTEGRVRLFTDVYFTPIAIDLLCPLIEEMAGRDATGVFHAAGGERVSKYAFGVQFARNADFDPTRIAPASVDDVPLKARRPRDMSLATGKIERFLGRAMPDCRESLQAHFARSSEDRVELH